MGRKPPLHRSWRLPSVRKKLSELKRTVLGGSAEHSMRDPRHQGTGKIGIMKHRFTTKPVSIAELKNPRFLKKNVNKVVRFVTNSPFFFKAKKKPIVPKGLKPVEEASTALTAFGALSSKYKFEPEIVSRIIHKGKEIPVDIHLYPSVVTEIMSTSELSTHLLEQFSHLKSMEFFGVIKHDKKKNKFRIVVTFSRELEGITREAFQQEAFGEAA